MSVPSVNNIIHIFMSKGSDISTIDKICIDRYLIICQVIAQDIDRGEIYDTLTWVFYTNTN